ncbi:hypothetical protein BVRB_4g074220 [Beta vulgaris subsp. vulgaris]|nr:hypothetical protein BVRB_4g074220 [Beta vulgaris subsp. vulgaris]
MAAQQAHGAHQLSNKEKAAIDAAVKEAANNIKNAKASQEQLVVVTGVMKNLQPRGLSLTKSHQWRGNYLVEPPKGMGESGAFVHEGAPSQGNLPVVIVGSKAFVIYSPLDDALPALGWLLAWNKPAQNSEGINQVYVEAGDLGRLLNMKDSEIEEKLDASHDVSRHWDSETGAAAAARIEGVNGGRMALVGSTFNYLPNLPPQ